LALKNFALQSDTNSKKASSLVIGGIIIFVAMTAAYAVGYIIHLKIAPWNSRFSLPALPGLAIVVFTLIEIIITDLKKRHILISILIGLLIGSQNQNTLNFKTVWEKQENLYQQLKWRGPSIKSGTAIIANEEIVSYMGDYPLSFAINTLYEAKPANELPYWFFAISENFNFSIDKVFEEDQLHTERASAVFLGNPEDVVFITYEPENGQCLWVLRPEFSEHKHLPPNLKTAALRSNTNNILEPAANFSVYNQIVDENTNTWCYFYQKAELARQKQDWTRIISLWEEAQSRNLRPYNGFEYLPFIESYANLQKWDEAYNLTSRANKTTKAMYFLLCPTWERLTNETQPSEEKEKYSIDAYQLLKCAVP
ncbi:MAG TPA: hypothetical protein DCX53_14560, partial [Anaerolineae bacterium]|nr:hypothetical protein [Anaerolineae bacterium]